MTRAKFVVEAVDKDSFPGSVVVRLHAVYEGSEENKTFWKYTPAGQITLTISNPSASEMFVLGKEIYVDFSEAN